MRLKIVHFVPNSLDLPREFLTGTSQIRFLHPISECEIREADKSFKPGIAVGYDNIPMSV